MFIVERRNRPDFMLFNGIITLFCIRQATRLC
jgi:hypothetical protein